MNVGMVLMGLFVGFMVGLTGVGGAALLTPFLIFLGINPAIAVGTDLAYNSITKFFGSIQHWRQKTINFQLMKYLLMGSVPGAIVAVGMLRFFHALFQNQDQIIKLVLGYVLIFVALSILLKTFGKKEKWSKFQVKSIAEKKKFTIFIGAVLGFLVGMTSIGSGSLFALVMLLFYKLAPAKLVGTDIAHAFILVTVASVLYASMGNVEYGIMFNLLAGSIPGVILGSTLSSKFPEKPLRTVMAVMIMVSGFSLI